MMWVLKCAAVIASLWMAYALGHLHGSTYVHFEALNNTWTWHKLVRHEAGVESNASCQRSLRSLTGLLEASVQSHAERLALLPQPLEYAASLPTLLSSLPRLGLPSDLPAAGDLPGEATCRSAGCAGEDSDGP